MSTEEILETMYPEQATPKQAAAKATGASDSAILAALERLGALFPWENVELWVTRAPQGTLSFTAHLAGDGKGMSFCFGHGLTVAETVADLIRAAGIRDPEALRERKLAELREEIRKLEALDLRYPPYRPGTRLAPGALAAEVDVVAEKEAL